MAQLPDNSRVGKDILKNTRNSTIPNSLIPESVTVYSFAYVKEENHHLNFNSTFGRSENLGKNQQQDLVDRIDYPSSNQLRSGLRIRDICIPSDGAASWSECDSKVGHDSSN